MTTDFRRADPTFVNFVPRTAADAIDLFNRHRNMGLRPALFPECFVHVCKGVSDSEIDKFHRWVVSPDGDVTKGGEQPTPIDVAIEHERLRLLHEAQARDELPMIFEMDDEKVPMDQDDEKVPMDQDDEKVPMDEDDEKMSISDLSASSYLEVRQTD